MKDRNAQLYEDFVEYVRVASKKERSVDHRRMFSLLLWCVVAPAVVAGTLLFLTRFGVIAMRWRVYVEQVILFFPITYSIYFMSSGFFKDLPRAFAKGNLSIALDGCLRESDWRARVWRELSESLGATQSEWAWIRDQFRIDLERVIQRTRYVTVLAGAILYLVLEGIDSIGRAPDPSVSWVRDPTLGWVELTGRYDYIQMIGLALFLVLLYLSGSQTYHALNRYRECIPSRINPNEDHSATV